MVILVSSYDYLSITLLVYLCDCPLPRAGVWAPTGTDLRPARCSWSCWYVILRTSGGRILCCSFFPSLFVYLESCSVESALLPPLKKWPKQDIPTVPILHILFVYDVCLPLFQCFEQLLSRLLLPVSNFLHDQASAREKLAFLCCISMKNTLTSSVLSSYWYYFLLSTVSLVAGVYRINTSLV